MRYNEVRVLVRLAFLDFAESVESRVYMARENGKRDVADALQDVADSARSAAEEVGR
jgi:hypothetical protein